MKSSRTRDGSELRWAAHALPYGALRPLSVLTVRHRRCYPADKAVDLNRRHPRAGSAAAASGGTRRSSGVHGPHRDRGPACRSVSPSDDRMRAKHSSSACAALIWLPRRAQLADILPCIYERSLLHTLKCRHRNTSTGGRAVRRLLSAGPALPCLDRWDDAEWKENDVAAVDWRQRQTGGGMHAALQRTAPAVSGCPGYNFLPAL